MSIRAYLVHTEYKTIDNEVWHIHRHEYLWNNWSESEIFDILSRYGNDMTNNECIGIVEITYDCWNDLKNDYSINNNSYNNKLLKKVIEMHKDVFQKIDSEFKIGNDYITIELY